MCFDIFPQCNKYLHPHINQPKFNNFIDCQKLLVKALLSSQSASHLNFLEEPDEIVTHCVNAGEKTSFYIPSFQQKSEMLKTEKHCE